MMHEFVDICKQVARTLGVSRGTFKMSTLLEYKGEQIGTFFAIY
jgi:hypothetical protein